MIIPFWEIQSLTSRYHHLKKTWKAKGKQKGWHRKVKCPLQVIQGIGNCAKLLPAFSTPSCCLSTWISHLAFLLLVLCYASRAQLHHVRRAIFRGKLLQPCPAEQAGKGFPEASLLHDGIGMAELTLPLGMLRLWPPAPPMPHLCSHGMENSEVPDVKANCNKK